MSSERGKYIPIIIACGAAATIFFQNCSKASFKSSGANSSAVQASGDSAAPSPDPGLNPSPTPNPNPTPNPDPGSNPEITPTAGPELGTPPSEIPDFQCLQTQVLQYSDNMQIPARDNSGTCYAVQVMTAIPRGASSLTKNIDTTVISRNHDVSASDPTQTHNPYLMDSQLLNFTFQGLRKIKLSGAADAISPILVDNFILVGFGTQGTALSPEQYSAYGTSDSTVFSTGGILLNNEVVALTPFASSGTATVKPLDISQTILAGQGYTLDLRAEDCGGQRQLSNIFVVFQ